MLKEHQSFFRKLMICLDLFIVTGVFLLYPLWQNGYEHFITHLGKYIVVLPVLILTWGVFLYNFGLYESFRTKGITAVLFPIIETAFVGGGFFGCFIFFTKTDSISRGHVFYSFLCTTIFLCLEKLLLLLFFRYQRKKGFNTRNLLIVGTGKRASHFIDMINKNPEWGIRIVGILDEDPEKTNNIIFGHKVIGAIKNLPDIIHNTVVDEVMFVVPRSWLNRLEDMISYLCDVEGLKVSVAVDLFTLTLAKAKYSHLIIESFHKAKNTSYKFPLLIFDSTPDKLLHLFIKRLFDIAFSSIALMLLSPVFVIIASVIKITSEGPIFFIQQRCTLYGRVFNLYKFRTMVTDAENKLKDLLEKNEMKGPAFKMENDPRVTKAGRFLRKFSLDELPQFWNVLKGDMSLVGPRPPVPTEVKQYEPWHRRRLSMRPGLTCLWQVSGRNTIIDFDEWMKLDLEYIDNWSLWLDWKILFGTIPAVLSGSGAK